MKEKKKLTPEVEDAIDHEKRKAIIIGSTCCLACLVGGGLFGSYLVHEKYKMFDDPDISKIVETYNLMVNEWFFGDEYIKTNVTNGAITGLVDQGDRYTFYTTSMNEQNLSLNQVGLGFKYDYYGGNAIVTDVFEDAPCGKGTYKLDVGDIIVASYVNNNFINLNEKSINDISRILNNNGEDNIKYKVIDASTHVEEEVSFVRGEYKFSGVRLVSSQKVDGKLIVEIKIDTFLDAELSSNVFNLLAKQTDEYGSKIDQLVIDLRNNGGGYVDQAISLCSLFVPKGTSILQYVYKDGTVVDYKTRTSPSFSNINKFVIKQNKGSASASETFTLAMMNLTNCTVAGDISYGKGIIQSLHQFKDGSVLRYTIAKSQFHAADGTNICIHGVGIKPDDDYSTCMYYFGELDFDTLTEQEYRTATDIAIQQINLLLDANYEDFTAAVEAFNLSKGITSSTLSVDMCKQLQKDCYDYYMNHMAIYSSNFLGE